MRHLRRVSLGLLILLLALGTSAGARTVCAHPRRLANGDVLCCCQTANGGTCCAEQGICGSIVPGCFCVGHH